MKKFLYVLLILAIPAVCFGAYPSDTVRTKNWGASDTLTESDLEGQFDVIHTWLDAFADETSGHSHDGTANEGPQIDLTGSVTGALPVANGGTALTSGFYNGAPPGSVVMWTTDTAPTNWLLCYGQAVSRSTYATLYAVIGDTFGSGDGSTTFNLPDMRGRFPLGQDDMGGSSANRVTDTDADTLGGADGDESKTITANNLPEHTHDVTVAPNQDGSALPSKSATTTGSTTVTSAVNSTTATALDIMPPFLTLNFIIRYQ